MNIAIVFAGGSGVRMGAGIPKQFLEVNGKPIIVYTLQLFQYHNQIDKIYLAVLEEYIPYMRDLVLEYNLSKVKSVLPGGSTAQDTIYNALKKAQEENDENSIVLLHDGVRPFVSYDVITKNIESVKKYGNAITSTPCFETIIISRNGKDVDKVPYRKDTFSAQAPQSFYLKDIIEVHEKIRQLDHKYENMVDACTMFQSLHINVHLVEGNRGNIKVTTPEDVFLFRALMQYKESEQAFGVGGLTNKIDSRLKIDR